MAKWFSYIYDCVCVYTYICMLSVYSIYISIYVYIVLGFLDGSGDKESTFSAGHLGLIPGLGRPLEKGIATHSSILAWRIPWTERPGGLQSVGSQRVGYNWATNTRYSSSTDSLWDTFRVDFQQKYIFSVPNYTLFCIFSWFLIE